jgi:hypothetical protein
MNKNDASLDRTPLDELISKALDEKDTSSVAPCKESEFSKRLASLAPEIRKLPRLTKATADQWGSIGFQVAKAMYGGKIADESVSSVIARLGEKRKKLAGESEKAEKGAVEEGIRGALKAAFMRLAEEQPRQFPESHNLWSWLRIDHSSLTKQAPQK